jgi:hypothetical protein
VHVVDARRAADAPQAAGSAPVAPHAASADAIDERSNGPGRHPLALVTAAPTTPSRIADRGPEPASVPTRLPVATAVEQAPVPLVTAAPEASRQVNREIHIGEISVELGEPLPPLPAVEPAGSLIAAIARPSSRPWRRL